MNDSNTIPIHDPPELGVVGMPLRIGPQRLALGQVERGAVGGAEIFFFELKALYSNSHRTMRKHNGSEINSRREVIEASHKTYHEKLSQRESQHEGSRGRRHDSTSRSRTTK